MSARRVMVRGRIAVGLATALLILLPAGGLVAGGLAAAEWVEPGGSEPHCGLFALTLLVEAGSKVLAAALAGLAVGLGVGWVLILGLFRWANGSGLGETGDDPPMGQAPG